MKRLWLFIALFGACGKTNPPRIRFHFDNLPLSKASCPVLPSDVTVLARLIINGDVANACPLTFTEVSASGAYTVGGECNGVATGTVLQLLLQWYALSPNQQRVVLLAESPGTLDTTAKDRPEYDANFTVINTKAGPTDPPSDRDRFNCDRTGVYTCDTSAAPATVTSDVDTCSNLEELCMDTLFNAARLNDQCAE